MRDPMMAPQAAFAAEALWRDWRALCDEIGERRAGTAGERRAADYIAQGFDAAGADEVAIETFPCTSRRSETVEVHERHGRAWRRVDATALVGAPGTPGNRAITGELAWLELPENAHRLRRGSLRGKIVAILGPLPTALEVHRRLVAAQPGVVIHVDDRLPFAWTKNDGVYPHWAQRHGMPPTITVPYLDAWRWRRDGVAALKVRVAVDQVRAESQNVIAELRGRVPELPALVLTAHHDTQCNNVGADDNASGVVCLLALARALARGTRRRTIRLISFGTEEQLSVGSFVHVARHHSIPAWAAAWLDHAQGRAQGAPLRRIGQPGKPSARHGATPAQVGLVLNFDSVASPLGHFVMSVAGGERLARFMSRELARTGLDVAVHPEITPFSDQFPFNRAGVPSLWFMRTNFSGGRWQHHSRHDSLENVSPREVQRLLAAVHPLVTQLADATRWPFPARLPAAEHALARKLGRELFG